MRQVGTDGGSRQRDGSAQVTIIFLMISTVVITVIHEVRFRLTELQTEAKVVCLGASQALWGRLRLTQALGHTGQETKSHCREQRAPAVRQRPTLSLAARARHSQGLMKTPTRPDEGLAPGVADHNLICCSEQP